MNLALNQNCVYCLISLDSLVFHVRSLILEILLVLLIGANEFGEFRDSGLMSLDFKSKKRKRLQSAVTNSSGGCNLDCGLVD